MVDLDDAKAVAAAPAVSELFFLGGGCLEKRMEEADLESMAREVIEGLALGDRVVRPETVTGLYADLRAIADRILRGERRGHTLQPTALANEAFLRMADQDRAAFENEQHYLMVAARMMRRILVDYARMRNSRKRGAGWERVTIAEAADAAGEPVDVLAVEDALDKLSGMSEVAARLVELRLFGGLKAEDAAELLGIARSTAAKEWRSARAWLAVELADG